MKRIGLLGCGAIGSRIAAAIDSGDIPAVLSHIYDTDVQASARLAASLKSAPEIVPNAHLLSSNDTDVIVEAASQDAVRESALGILQNRKDMMIMSAGALLDESVLEVLTDACTEFSKTIYLPSGAVAGIDAIRAVRAELESVILETTKHPDSLKDAPYIESEGINLDDFDNRQTVFEGTAGEAVSAFPRNINVAALLSLAGLGRDITRVRIVVDPGTSLNTHRITASGKFGRMEFLIENRPDPLNPRSSRLAVLSAIETLRVVCSGGIRLGT